MSTPNPYHESPFAFHIAVKRVRLTLVIEEKNMLAMLIPIKTSLFKENQLPATFELLENTTVLFRFCWNCFL